MRDSTPQSTSGVRQVAVSLPTNLDNGLTAEQRNIRERLLEDNKPDSVKHLYVISAYSGQVIIYSTVRGKVTSGGKRLTPYKAGTDFTRFRVPHLKDYSGSGVDTNEIIQDDGTYGYSGDYLYWWDTDGAYHQHYVSGGQIVHVSNQPLAVAKIVDSNHQVKWTIDMDIPQKPLE